jgi:hypothetical protein
MPSPKSNTRRRSVFLQGKELFGVFGTVATMLPTFFGRILPPGIEKLQAINAF